jgi:hypothetical protein
VCLIRYLVRRLGPGLGSGKSCDDGYGGLKDPRESGMKMFDQCVNCAHGHEWGMWRMSHEIESDREVVAVGEVGRDAWRRGCWSGVWCRLSLNDESECWGVRRLMSW